MAGKIQLLVSAVNQDAAALAEQMNICTDAVIVNQCDRYGYEEIMLRGHRIQVFSMAERGVGLSRNTALLHADAQICVFSDEDIVLQPDYAEQVGRAYDALPDADMILFNVQVAPARRTYWNEDIHRINYRNYGRYPAYSITARQKALRRATVCIGEEKERESTWFSGYHEKFFRDRGVLYHYLYGRLALPLSFRFLWVHRQEMCREIPLKQAYRWMKDGVKEARA